MGIWDSVKGVAIRSGRNVEAVIFEPSEAKLAGAASCTVNPVGFPLVGGELVLTNTRLLFLPKSITSVVDLLAYGLKKVGAPSGAMTAVGSIGGQLPSVGIVLPAIVGVVAGRSAETFHPPTIVVEVSDGRQLEFGMLSKRLGANRDHANEVVRDDFIAQCLRSLEP